MATYDIHALARIARISPRTVRSYFEQNVLPKPVFRGARTTYGDEHVIRLKAVRHLLHGEGLSFAEIRARLGKLSLPEIAALVPGGVGVAIRGGKGEPASEPPRPASSTAAREAAASALPSLPDGEAWRRVPLLPGLELHLSSAASAVVQRIAREIVAYYAPAEAPDAHEEAPRR